MRISTRYPWRERRSSILGTLRCRVCILIAGLLFTTFASPARAGWAEASAAYQRGDYRAAFEEFLPLARAGDPVAQFVVGLMYADGEGVAKNEGEAAKWYRRSAEQGDAEAQLNLAVMYDLGEGVVQDDVEAVKWYRRSAEQGLVEAQYNLALMHYNGEGVPQSYAEAMKWFRRAAEQGDADAQREVGVMYYNGRGVPQDFTKAAKWLRRAANQNHALAQALLGSMYYLGQGVPEDNVRAHMWLNLAAAHLPAGEARDGAAELRDRAAGFLSLEEIARAQRMARDWRPTIETAAAADIPGPSDLGIGGTPQSSVNGIDTLEEAKVWLTQRDLAALGYDPGAMDGIAGPKTRAAIRAFQADVGLQVDGRISETLTMALRVLTGSADHASTPATTAEPHLDGTGTGFVISQNGRILTNHHVVDTCTEVRVGPSGQEAVAAAVLAQDSENDLALLETSLPLPSATFREGRGIRAGEDVVAVGFPLHGLLASEANVTTGTVSALAGIGNDTRFLQMTVPVQPGNSGGPLLDPAGHVVGIVVGKLDALQVASAIGDIPQNVNFAIKATLARSFLDANGVGYEMAPSADELGAAEIGERAMAFTVLVECWR